MLISLNKLPEVLTQFIDSRLIPTAPAHIKWLLGGSTFILLDKFDNYKERYVPTLKNLDLVNTNNQLDIDKTKQFLDCSFNKCQSFTVMGFTFNKDDGEALYNLLVQHKDEEDGKQEYA